jgi:anti-sigma factor RsiW
LDDYLGGNLGGAERSAFTAHLSLCPACRQAVEEQEWMDRLLTRAVAALEPMPPALADRVRSRLRRARRLRRLAAVAAAAVIALGVTGWLLVREHAGQRDVAVTRAAPRREELPASEPEPVVRVRIRSPSDAIAVQMKSDNRNVTIWWVYPAATITPSSQATNPAPSPLPEGSSL